MRQSAITAALAIACLGPATVFAQRTPPTGTVTLNYISMCFFPASQDLASYIGGEGTMCPYTMNEHDNAKGDVVGAAHAVSNITTGGFATDRVAVKIEIDRCANDASGNSTGLQCAASSTDDGTCCPKVLSNLDNGCTAFTSNAEIDRFTWRIRALTVTNSGAVKYDAAWALNGVTNNGLVLPSSIPAAGLRAYPTSNVYGLNCDYFSLANLASVAYIRNDDLENGTWRFVPRNLVDKSGQCGGAGQPECVCSAASTDCYGLALSEGFYF
jgi:hypothetical protein